MDREIPLNLPSLPTLRNRGAIHWSLNGLIAVGSGTDIVIIDENLLFPVQVIHSEHKSSINRVLWNNFSRQLDDAKGSKYEADLLSTDTLNNISVWDVERAKLLATFTHPDSKQLLDMKWCHGPDAWKRGKVYLLYLSNVLIIYDILNHQVFQNCTIGDYLGMELTGFDVNPFSTGAATNYAFLGDGCLSFGTWDPTKASDKVVVTANIILQKSPVSNTSSGSPSTHSNSYTDAVPAVQSQPITNFGKKQSSSSSIRKLVSDIIVGPENPMNQVVAKFGTLQYLESVKDHLIVWTNRDIYLINTYFQTVLYIYSLEKSITNLVAVFGTKYRPCLYTVHENGTVFLRKYSITNNLYHSHNVSVTLDTVCCNDNPRFSSKKCEVLGGAVRPKVHENKVVIYLSDGRFTLMSLACSKSLSSGVCYNSSGNKLLLPTPVSPESYIRHFISSNRDLRHQSDKFIEFPDSVTLPTCVKGILDPIDTNSDRFKIKTKRTTPAFCQITCLQCLRSGVLVVGTAAGHILIVTSPMTSTVNKKTLGVPKIIKKILMTSNSAISGIETISENEVLVWNNLSLSANPKCELIIVETNIGAIKILKQDEPSHIGAVRVSPSKLYFVVVYKNGSSPSELWDLPRRQLIKVLPSKLPPITCVRWKTPSDDCRDDTFFMTDLGTFLFTFRVDGNRFSTATCVKLEGGNVGGIPVALFTRRNLVFRADSSGSLVIYNTDKKTASPGINLGRGPLFKILDFEDFFVTQFSDQLELWDLNTVQRLRIINSTKLKTTEIAILMSDVLAVVIKNSGSLKFLRLHATRSSAGDWYPTVRNVASLLSQVPQFSSNQQKFQRILFCISKSPTDRQHCYDLIQEIGCNPDEIKFWAIFCDSLLATSSPMSSDPNLFSPGNVYKEILVKVAQCVWQLDSSKREMVARTLIFAGENEKSAEILLDTDPADAMAYTLHGMKASICVGSSTLPEPTKAVLKIAATNLIASGRTNEGLELLCMLQKYSEACSYIESTNDWEKALLLCKTSLFQNLGSFHAKETLSRYAQFLNTCKFVLQAASLYAYVGKFDRAVETLVSARRKHLAFIVLHICEANGVEIPISEHVRLAIKLDFARCIFDVGLHSEAIEFCDTLGIDGCDLKSELQILST